jgi:hypothetical protein
MTDASPEKEGGAPRMDTLKRKKSERETLVVRAGSGKLDSWDKWLFCLTVA